MAITKRRRKPPPPVRPPRIPQFKKITEPPITAGQPYLHREPPEDFYRSAYPPNWDQTFRPVLSKFSPGYDVSYWENPLNIARAYWQSQSAGPYDEMPEWMDTKSIEMAYRYMEKIQGTDEWVNWKYIHPEDPIRPFLQQLKPPGPKYLLDDNDYQDYLVATLASISPDLWTPEQMGDLDPRTRDQLLQYQETYGSKVPFEDLPTWQRIQHSILSSPVAHGVSVALPFALMGGVGGLAAGGPLAPVTASFGFLTPLALGAGLGYLAESSPEAATLLEKLDYPALWIEQGLGTYYQAIGSIVNPEVYGPLDEVLSHLEESAQAAKVTYETGAALPVPNRLLGLEDDRYGRYDIANIFPAIEYSVRWIGEQLGMDTDVDSIQFADMGEAWPHLNVFVEDGQRYVIGDYEPVQLDAVGLSAVVNARRELIGGADPNEVMFKYSEQFGFSGQVSDLIGHIVLDPLNIAPTVIAQGIGTVADYAKNPVMARAFKSVHGPIAGWKKYGDFIRTGVAGAQDTLGAFARFAGALNEQGIMRKLVPEVSQYGPVRRWLAHLVELTPKAKSRTLLKIGADNIMNFMDYAKRLDPLAKTSYLRRLINSTPTEMAQIAPFLGSPEWGTLRQALAGFGKSLDEFDAMWIAGEQPRSALFRLSEVLEESPVKILEAMGDAKNAESLLHRYIERLNLLDTEAAKLLAQDIEAGLFTAETLQDTMKSFTGDKPLPWHPDEHAARLTNAFEEHIADWAVAAYGATKSGPVMRMFDVLKRAQSVVLLGFNPAYLVNNTVNNVVTRAASGLWGFTSMNKINAYIDRFGYKPHRFGAGVGAAGEVAGKIAGAGGDIITKATMHAKENWAERALSFVERGTLFTKASAAVEASESAQAFHLGLNRTMDDVNRFGVGLTWMDPGLEASLREFGADPPTVKSLIEGSVSVEEGRSRIQGDFNRFDPDVHLRSAARDMGMEVSELREVLRPIYDDVKTEMTGALAVEQVSAGFDNVRKRFQEHLNNAMTEDVKTRVEQVASQVGSAGFGEVIRIWTDYQKYLDEFVVSEVRAWDETFTRARQLQELNADPSFIQLEFDRRRGEAKANWTRNRKFEQGTMLGFMEGLNAKETVVQVSLKHMEDIGKLHDNFFATKQTELNALGKKKFKSSEQYYAALEELERKHGADYIRMSDQVRGINTALDEIFIEMNEVQFGEQAGVASRVWRENIRDMAEARTVLINDHYSDMVGQPYDIRRRGWGAFNNEKYLPFMKDFYDSQVALSMEYSKAVTGDGPSEFITTPRVEPEEVAPPTGPEAEIAGMREAAEATRARLEEITRGLKEGRQIGLKLSAEDVGDNYLRPLLDFTDVLFRETNAEQASRFLPTDAFDNIETSERLFFANTENLALGQGENVGVMLEFSTEGLQGRINTQKPAWETSFDAGEAEIVGSMNNARAYKDNLVSVMIRQDAVVDAGFTRLLENLESRGWQKVETERGAKYTRPGEVTAPEAPYVQTPADATEISRIASEHSVPLLNEEGRYIPGSEAHTLNIIKQTFPDVLSLEDVSPEMARQAFEARELRHLEDGRGTTKVDLPAWQEALEKRLRRVVGKTNISDETAPAARASAYGPYQPGVLEDILPVKYESMNEAAAWSTFTGPALDALEETMIRNADSVRNLNGIELPENISTQLDKWLNKTWGELNTNKIAAVRWAEDMRDHALLNYENQYGANRMGQVGYPYHFWYTRSMWEWAQRFIDRPAWFANMGRLRNQFRKSTQTPGFPTRLIDRMSIPAPYLPEWAGGSVWVDPIRKFFPIEEFTGPIDYIASSKDEITRSAEYTLIRWIQDGVVPESAAAEAFASHQGELWERAMSQARMNIAGEEAQPENWVDTIMSPALYLTIPAFMMTGRDPTSGREDLPLLPMTRFGMSLRTVTENTPAHMLGQMLGSMLAYPESAWRKHAGLSEFGDWGEYYVDRQLSNIATEGLYDEDDAIMAMIERQGPVYEEARKRVELEIALKVPGALPTYALGHEGGVDGFISAAMFGWLPGNLLPKGELEQRGLNDLYNLAWKRKNMGDDQAMNEFFDKYPQYEARLALFPEQPEERLREFLISNIWDIYTDLPGVDRQLARQEFGDLFTQGFLDDPTGRYEMLDVETLAYWARAMGGRVPEVPGTEAITQAPDILFEQLQFAPPNEAAAVDAYRKIRDANFPAWYALQSTYFATPKPERKAFLREFPELVDYWDWNRDYKKANPVIEKYTRKPDEDSFNVPYNLDFVSEFSTPLARQLFAYYLLDEPLSSGTLYELRNAWLANGQIGGSFDDFLDVILREAVAP